MSATPLEPAEPVIRRHLAAHGPMTTDALIDALVAEGVDLGACPEDRLLEVLDEGTDVVVALTDGRLAWLPGLLEGRVFTHRLSGAEAAHDFLGIGPDLMPVTILTESEIHRRLVDGSQIGEVGPWSDVALWEARGLDVADMEHDQNWLLPPGHFEGVGAQAGDLIGVRVTDAGFDIIAVDAVKKSTAAAAIAARLGPPDHPETVAEAVWMVCDKHIDAFREPVAPLGELLTALGLVLEGEWVAPAGFDFDIWRASTRIGDLMTHHDLDLDEATAVLTALRLHERISDVVDTVFDTSEESDWGDDNAPLPQLMQRAHQAATSTDFEADTRFMDTRDALDFFDEPIVAEAFLSEASSGDGFFATTLVVFAQFFEKLAPRAARPAMLWLQGRAHEHVGEIELAEQAFRAAEALDPAWPLTLMSLARLASDRGDAERGLSLLRRAGTLPDAPLMKMLEAFQPAPHPDLARNAPCWCGSGRKYKQCHLREQLSLAERAAWLYEKAVTDLLAGPFSSLLLDVASARTEDREVQDALGTALDDQLVRDVVLFEGGAFAHFLDRRGSLLPKDELQLAEQWLLVERSVHDVVGVQPGVSMTLRDLRTGDVNEVHAAAVSTGVQPGELYCARVVPAGGTMHIVGGLAPVSPDERDDLVALLDNLADPVELVAVLSRQSLRSGEPPAPR
ncbi:SEC-C domain-containing protein [Tessaracoccus antarcticus]|nr:SEC-C domain-containing protein [Tessaracoccus antarcticus]